MSKLRMSGAIPPLPLYTFMACIGTTYLCLLHPLFLLIIKGCNVIVTKTVHRMIGLLMNWKVFGRRWSWPYRGMYLIDVESLRKATKKRGRDSRCPDWESSQAPTAYKSMALLETRLVSPFSCYVHLFVLGSVLLFHPPLRARSCSPFPSTFSFSVLFCYMHLFILVLFSCYMHLFILGPVLLLHAHLPSTTAVLHCHCQGTRTIYIYVAGSAPISAL
jgi:hypothetical protein